MLKKENDYIHNTKIKLSKSSNQCNKEEVSALADNYKNYCFIADVINQKNHW
jgi:organic hydroperoxide reductase OsmC/OhrA